MKDTCKNCGGWKGLHRYGTGQCPLGGKESPVGKPDVWTFATYEPEDDSAQTIAALEADKAELVAALKTAVTYFPKAANLLVEGVGLPTSTIRALIAKHGGAK